MTTKKLLLLATMLALPFGANADDYTYNIVNTPALVANHGTVTRAYPGQYQTITPGADDDKHIASTKYVIGAYNDAIAAINTKQNVLFNALTDDEIYSDVIGSDDFLAGALAGDYESALESKLVSAEAVKAGIKSQHVTIYTTWEDDTANGTTVVPLTTVVPED